MNTGPVDREILDMAVDDYTGLWEVLNGVRQGELSLGGDPEITARAAVSQLISRGWLVLYKAERLGENEAVVEKTQIDHVLGEPRNWLAPEPGVMQYHVAATEAGERHTTEDRLRKHWLVVRSWGMGARSRSHAGAHVLAG
jgi:hypothetical protein